MKVAILAGGLGSRLAEETEIRPKPMVEVGGKPILWHIMKLYSHYGFDDFAIALGYKGEYIKRFFVDIASLTGDLKIDLGACSVSTSNAERESWKVDLVETGADTATGGRIKKLEPHIGDETFFLTWGDGVADIDLIGLLAFHRSHGKLVTVTAVRPQARFGKLDLDGDRVVKFSEKPQLEEGWINGAFFVCEPEVFGYIDGDDTQFEREPLEMLAKDGELRAYRHYTYWQCMDTIRDRKSLEAQWQSGERPWAVWERRDREQA